MAINIIGLIGFVNEFNITKVELQSILTIINIRLFLCFIHMLFLDHFTISQTGDM